MPISTSRLPLGRSYLSAPLALFLLAGCSSSPGLPKSSLGPNVTGYSSDQLTAKYGNKISPEGNAAEFKLKPIAVEAAAAGLTKFAVVDGKPVAVPDIAMGDSRTVNRILDEGMNRNQVLTHLHHLTTDIGPRLTGSTNAETANYWARDQFASWGLTDSHVEEWGTINLRFDRGPSTAKVVRSTERRGDDGQTVTEWTTLREMQFTTLAWAPGTNGSVRGSLVRMPKNEAELQAVKDKIAGSWILIGRPGEGRTGVRGGPQGVQRTTGTLADIRKKWENPDPPMPQDGRSGYWKGKLKSPQLPGDGFDIEMALRFAADNTVTGTFDTGTFGRITIRNGVFDPATGALTFSYPRGGSDTEVKLKITDQSLEGTSKGARGESTITATRDASTTKEPTLDEKVLAAKPAGYIFASNEERIWTSAATDWRELTPDTVAKDVVVTIRQSDYDFLNSRLADGLDFQVEMDLQHKFTAGPIPCYNTIAEIKGSEKPDEVVIVSAHLDSWNGPGSQGATDNGTGSSVTLEAARILSTVIKNGGKPPKRTIRFILWTGEEQGLLGSAGYIEKHKDELPKISAVFVDDGGTNYEGGLGSLVGTMTDYLAAATAPVNSAFPDLTVNIRPLHNKDGVPATRLSGGEIEAGIGGGSDHMSFNRQGVPGFFWDEEGRANYGYGWHTQNDKYDLAIPEYLVQSSTCAAITAYNLACAPEMLPRVAIQAPPGSEGNRPAGNRPQGGGGGGGQRP